MKLVCLVTLVLTLGAAPGSRMTSQQIAFPGTPAGRSASAWFDAFNSGHEASMRAFFEAHLSAPALARRAMDDRLALYRDMHGDHGRLTPVTVLASDPLHMSVVASDVHGDRLTLSFDCEPEPPNGLLGVRVEMGAGAAPPASPEPGAGSSVTPSDAIARWAAMLDSLGRSDAFSGTALIARHDTVLFERAWGLASRERNVPNTLDTKFNLGSINKVFTKLAIAQLVEQGRIRLDDTIDRYLPDYPRDVASRVTVRQLLGHRGGVGDVFGDRYGHADRSKLRTVADWIPLFRDEPLHFAPGTRQEYSNGGYVLLGAIIEQASGANYYDYVRRHIYTPLGMNDTDHFADDETVAARADGYTRRAGAAGRALRPGAGETGPAVAEPTPWINNAATRPMRGSPAGGGYSTLHDLLRFTQALRRGTLVRPETLRDGFEDLAADRDGNTGVFFGGGAPGINAAVALEGPWTVIVLANVDPPAAEQAARIARALGGGGGPGDGVRVRIGGGASGVETDAAASPAAHAAHGGATETGPGTMAVHAPRDFGKPARTTLPAAGVDVPMFRSAHLPVVEVEVNGRGPYRFAIDTGAQGSARIDSALAVTLGLHTVGEAMSGDPSGRHARPVALVAIDALEIGGARFEQLTASIRSDGLQRPGEHLDGILGFGLFAECLLTLDYPAGRVRLEQGVLPPGSDVVPITIARGIPSTRIQVDSLTLDADVDAGSMGGFTLPARLESTLALASPPRVVGRARTAGNTFDIEAAELQGHVRLAGHDFPHASVTFQPVFPMANVGARVLQDFRVTFDQRNARMRMVRVGG